MNVYDSNLVAECSVSQCQEKWSAGHCILLDVRTWPEYEEVHVQGAEWMPLAELDIEKVRKLSEKKEVLVMCLSGGRARQAAQKLTEAGVKAVVVSGGIQAWQAAELEVIKGQSKMIPLMRQVQIVVGGVVLGSSLMAWSGYTQWIWVSAFIGAGLLFAGLTGFCGLALVLARMPWNQKKKSTSCCSR
jgi:rhodanese-related sulfurtransferase